MGPSNVYGLLNFNHEYEPTFLEVTESLRLMLGHDQVPWTKQAIEVVRNAASRALAGVLQIAFYPQRELQIKTRVVAGGIAIIGLQSNPQNKKKWLPVISWGRVLDKSECKKATPLLEQCAPQEGLHKLGAYTALAKMLTIWALPQLQALYKLAGRANPALQAALIDIVCYSPQWVLEDSRAPTELKWGGKPAQDKQLVEVIQVEDELKEPKKGLDKTSLPSAFCFKPGPFVHVQFNGGLVEGIGTRGFTIVGPDGAELVCAGKLLGEGYTNNEAEALVMMEALNYLEQLWRKSPQLAVPVRV